MSVLEELDYAVPHPNVVQRALRLVVASRPGAWLLARTAHHLDRAVLALSGGRRTAAQFVAGIPVVRLVTTGARTGRRRVTPLLGVPHDGGIAVIGTRFGQTGTPGWYYNLRSHPTAELRFHDRSAQVVACELQGEQWQAVWEAGTRLYPGYRAYAARIRGRQVHIMLLRSAGDAA
jgi:deazaflavin-dependent oxidoreductase (nitroreductase family)